MTGRRALASFLSDMARDPAKVDAYLNDSEGSVAGFDLDDADRAILLRGSALTGLADLCEVVRDLGKTLVVGSGGDGFAPSDWSRWPAGTSDLTVVGTGYLLDGQLTPQAESAIRAADDVLCVVDELTLFRVQVVNAKAESMTDLYQVGQPRQETYDGMVGRIMERVRADRRVTVVLYGHPGVFASPGHAAIRRAREEGFSARMLPGVSAEGAMFADLGFDPASTGCQSYEATDFLLHRRQFDVHSALVLWQVGSIGVRTYEDGETWNADGVAVLSEVLAEHYGTGHTAYLYRAAEIPGCPPAITEVAVGQLATATVAETLFVPPVGPAAVDADMAARLGLV